MMRHFKFVFLLAAISLLGFLSACGGGGGSSDGDSGSTGTLTTSLTDASTDEYKAVYVTIDRVEVHQGTGEEDDTGLWEVVAEPQATYNLLELVNGVRETLAVTSLEAGTYTQVRLIIGEEPDDGLNILDQGHAYANYVIDNDDNEIHALKVPSGTQTGIKIVSNFIVSAGQSTEIILDFDAMRSVVKAGASGKYLLKPTIKILETTEYAQISGQVTVSGTPETGLPGSLVTLQTISDPVADAKDAVVIEAGTVAGGNDGHEGEYALFVEPGSYFLVATKAGYNPVCYSAEVAAGESLEVDLPLMQSEYPVRQYSGTLTLNGVSDEQYATFDFRQELSCNNGGETEPVWLTVKTVNIINNSDFSVELPAGEYQVVISSTGFTTGTENVDLTTADVTEQTIELLAP